MKLALICLGIFFLSPIFAIPPAQGSEKMKKAPIVLGWFMSPHNSKSQYATVRNHYDVLTHVSQTRIAVADTEGNVACGTDNWLLNFAREKGLEVHPLVANGGFRKDIAHAVLSDPEKRAKVIKQLLAIIQDWECSGINIDFENVDHTDRHNLTAFMKELTEVFHKHDLVVSIDVAAKTHDAPTSAWAGVYDYKALGEIVDYVILMTYDEHWAGGSAGPIGSLPWVRKVVEYAVSVVPAEKVVLGVPFYGRDWPEEGRATSHTHVSVTKLIEEIQPYIQWDDTAKYHWFEYKDDEGKKRTVWYETVETMRHRIALAQEFELGGIAIWRLGDENPEYFDLLAKYRRGEPMF